jgi:hypothetical protein
LQPLVIPLCAQTGKSLRVRQGVSVTVLTGQCEAAAQKHQEKHWKYHRARKTETEEDN